jgi:hypothetical protein
MNLCFWHLRLSKCNQYQSCGISHLLPWRWRQQFPPKQWFYYKSSHPWRSLPSIFVWWYRLSQYFIHQYFKWHLCQRSQLFTTPSCVDSKVKWSWRRKPSHEPSQKLRLNNIRMSPTWKMKHIYSLSTYKIL